jgi:hypothetical protein
MKIRVRYTFTICTIFRLFFTRHETIHLHSRKRNNFWSMRSRIITFCLKISIFIISFEMTRRRLTLQFICTRCRLRTFYLAIEESSNWAVLSKTDYNCFVDHTTFLRRAAELFTACINRIALTTYRSNTQHHFWLIICVFSDSFDEKENAQSSTSQREIVHSSSSRSEFSFDSRRNSRLSSRLFEKSKQSIFDENVDLSEKEKRSISSEDNADSSSKRRRRLNF